MSEIDTSPEALTWPDRLWLSAPDADGDHSVWLDPDEGGTKYVRADLPEALIRTLRANLAGAEQERDAAIARAEKAEAGRDALWVEALTQVKWLRQIRGDLTGRVHGSIVTGLDLAVKYILAAIEKSGASLETGSAAIAARKPCDPADPCPVAQDLASENRTLDGLLAEATERAKDAEARSERMRAALHQAAVWFQEYADGHRVKGDSMKAARNQGRADACCAALAEQEADRG